MKADKEISDMLEKVRIILLDLGLPMAVFNKTWQQVTELFVRWLEKLPAAISPLTRNLELLRRLCDGFGQPELRNNQKLLNILLQGAVNYRESITLRGEMWRVIRRDITNRYSILYTLKNKNGEIIKHEFFD